MYIKTHICSKYSNMYANLLAHTVQTVYFVNCRYHFVFSKCIMNSPTTTWGLIQWFKLPAWRYCKFPKQWGGNSEHQNSGSLLGNFGHQNSENLRPSRNTDWEKNDPCVGLSPGEVVILEKATGMLLREGVGDRGGEAGGGESWETPWVRGRARCLEAAMSLHPWGEQKVLSEDFQNAF